MRSANLAEKIITVSLFALLRGILPSLLFLFGLSWLLLVAEDGHRELQDESGGPPWSILKPLELPTGARGSPRTIAKPFLDRKSCFLNMSLFMQETQHVQWWEVGLEFQIHPKRLREERKNDIDGPRTHPRPSSAARGEQTRPKKIPK